MNSNSVASGPAPIPDFTPLHDAFDMTPTPSEADAMSVRATVSYENELQFRSTHVQKGSSISFRETALSNKENKAFWKEKMKPLLLAE